MDTKHLEITQLLADVQQRWGANGLRPAREGTALPPVPTGVETLDSILRGGLPRGQVTELIGSPTSGMTTLALKVMAAIQRQGELSIYIDLAFAFDPDYAIQCGLNPTDMLLVRPAFEVAVSMLFDLVATGIPGILVVNVFPALLAEQRRSLAQVMSRLHPFLARSRCVLLLLTPPYPDEQLSSHAALRLSFALGQWRYQDGVVCGYQTRVTLTKHKSVNEGKSVFIDIGLTGGQS